MTKSLFAERGALFYKPPEMRVHLRCAAGDVHGSYARCGSYDLDTALQVFPVHVLPLFVGPGIHMAVRTSLIAQFANIELEDFNVYRLKGLVPLLG